MSDINVSSRDTVIDAMKILVDAGVVQRRRRLGSASWSFVDIEVLRAHAYTEEDIADFRSRWDAKAGKSTTTGRSAEEKALPLNSGKSTTTDVGKTTLTDVGEIPTAVGGNSPAYNPKLQPTGCNTKGAKPSVSESELADSDYDNATIAERSSSLPTVCKRQNDQDHSSDSEVENLLLKSGDVIPASGKGEASPPSPADGPEPDPKEYENIVHLCSLWWSTHPGPGDDIETSPTPEVHPWGHPRTWTPAQCREAFLNARQNDLNSEEPVPDDDSEPEPELEPDTDASIEEALLRDEQDMLELYLKEGLDVIEDVLVWLPQSKFWYSKTTSLAKLKADFDAVFASHEKYMQKALDNGTEDGCEDFVREVFLASGGAAADSICWARLNPLPPWDAQDAAEEAAADAFDDEFGVTIRNPWAEVDYTAAAELKAKGMVDAPFAPWSDGDAGDPADISDNRHANESNDEAEDEAPIYRYCEDCYSVHAGMCMPDEYSDLE